MTAVSLGEPAAAPYGFVSAAVGVGGASAAGTMPRRSATRAVRCTALGIARLRSATGAGLLQLSAQIDQRRASHVRDVTVPVLLGATIDLLGVVQRAPFLEQDAESRGELTLAASHTPSLILIPPVLRDFAERYPGVSVKLRTLPSEMVVREVARGAADIGIAGEVAHAEPVVRQQILIDELVGIAPVGLLGSDLGSVSRGEFARRSLLLGPEGSSTRMITERHLARAEYRPARIWAFDSSEAIKRAVADGIGISFMSRLLVGDAIERRDLVAFTIAGVGG